MSSTGTRSDLGIALEEILYLFKYIKSQNKSINLDIVEYNPLIGNNKEKVISKNTIDKLINTLFEK